MHRRRKLNDLDRLVHDHHGEGEEDETAGRRECPPVLVGEKRLGQLGPGELAGLQAADEHGVESARAHLLG